MNMHIEQEKGVQLCAVSGDVDMYAAPELFVACEKLLSRGPAPQLVLDLSGAPYMDSSGIGVLFQLCTLVRSKGGAFCLCGVSGMVEQLFRLSRMSAILPAAPDRAAAIQRVRGLQ